MELSRYFAQCREQVDQHLTQALQAKADGAELLLQPLHRAMTYAVFNGGKRIRPILTYATGHALDLSNTHLHAIACSVELIHAYSLVHDDLPCMDDDDLRRGKPTCHKAFDETTALLVGDGLQALAFQLASDPQPGLKPDQQLSIVRYLAQASGVSGMVGGQGIDLASVGKTLDLAQLKQMHKLKTGALIRASVMMAGLASEKIKPAVFKQLEIYAVCIGLAFQVQDDILDVEGDCAQLGKQGGADAAMDKPTYPSCLGLQDSKKFAASLVEQAQAALDTLGTAASILREIATYIIQRQY